MMKYLITLIKIILSIIFLFVLGHYIYSIIQPSLIFHTQQIPFFKNKVFFLQYTDYPGGICEYVTNFITQSFFYDSWGTYILLLLIIILMFVSKYITSQYKSGGKGFFWMFIPVLLTIILIHDYHFPLSVVFKILVALLAFASILSLKQKLGLIYTLIPVFALILYYIAGSGVMSVFLICTVLYFSLSLNLRIKEKLIIIIISSFSAFIITYIGYKYLFNITPKQKWFFIIPDLPIVLKYKPSKTFYIFVFSIPSLILLLSIADYCLLLAENKINSIYQKIKSLVEKNSIIFSLCLIVISSSLIYLTYKIICKKYYNLHEKNVILVDYYTVNKQWDKAYEIALQDNSYDYFENINFNRCVYNSGRFGRSFFIYPQLLGSDALFPDKIPAGQIALLSSDFYYELGYVSEALHWAYEAQSSLPYSIRVLERLTLVHLIEGRYDAAKTYIDILKDAYYTNDFVNKYSNYLKDTALISKDPEIQEKRQFMPHNFYTPSLSFQKFILLINVNPNNKRATEYLAMHYLLEHQIGNFIKIYDKLKDIYSDKIPHIYEHAITLYLLKTKNYDFKKYNIGKNSIEQVMDYYKTISQFSKKEAAYEILTKKYAGSYLYYLTYESPLVTKMTLKSRAVE